MMYSLDYISVHYNPLYRKLYKKKVSLCVVSIGKIEGLLTDCGWPVG